MADVSQIVLKDANGNVIGTYDVKDATVPHTSESASSGGTTLSLVTTGEKATWNNKADRVPLPLEYDATSTYSTGDLVTYNNDIYQCNTYIETAEAWDPAHWDLVTPDTDYLHSVNPNCYGTFSLNRKANTTIGDCSFAEGYNCTASSNQGCHAEGHNTTASGSAAHAEGSNTTARGLQSHAEGLNTVASGHNGSHAEGRDTTASGVSSHSEGSDTTASGNFSHSEGLYTTANHRSQHTFGEYNVLDPSTATASDKGNYVEIVGNGTATNARSNARTLDWSGNETLSGGLTSNSVSTTTLSATTLNGVTVGSSPKFTDNNTTYTFANGTNGFTVTPSGGTAQTVTVTPSITNNITGSGTTNYVPKFTGTNTIGNGWGTTTSVTSGSGSLVTSGGVYNAFTSRIKRTSSNRYFTSKTTMSYTGLSLTCPSGHVYVVQAWFRYANGLPRRVGACHLNTVFTFYDSVAASLDTYDCGNGSVTFMMYPGETIYYWAMYYNATQNFITENILDITL